jgi:predicted methyltransferase
VRALVTLALVAACATGCGRARAGVDREAVAYEQYRQPQTILAGLELAPGQRVADVGAGRGFLTTRIAAAVGPRGHVVATDIDAAALAATVLLMMALAGCGPSANDNPPELWLARGADELHAALVSTGPPAPY